MVRIFISYSRADKHFVEALAMNLRRIYGYDHVWFDEGLHGGDIWWEAILNQIADCDIFLYILSNDSVQSQYCQAEFEEARRLQKQIITVQARDKTKLTEQLSDIHYIDMARNPKDASAFAHLMASINKRQHALPKRRPKPLWKPRTAKPHQQDEKPHPNDMPDIDTPILTLSKAELVHSSERVSSGKRSVSSWLMVAIFSVILLVAIGLFSLITLLISNRSEKPLPTQSVTTVAQQATQYTTATRDQQATTNYQATHDALATVIQLSNTNRTATIDALYQVEQIALQSVDSNIEWQNLVGDAGYMREFDGVEMVLVPAGCFVMGNDLNSYQGRANGEQQCFERPFWIDRTEVTQSQFSRLQGEKTNPSRFQGADRPVEMITWFEARNFCTLRSGRLPTEAEWEYAARGPDALYFAWGNEWQPNYVTWRNNSQGTINVAMTLANTSWVGALDMSGNVWEWTRSVYNNYPYVATDGREVNLGNALSVQYTLRGGSWNYDSTVDLRAATRDRFAPSDTYSILGFRCVRAYES